MQNPIIEIRTYDDENNSYLDVSDNGRGIPESIIDKIFDPCFSTKTTKDGMGLGLYMSKIIIEEHCNGKLTVSNNQNGVVFKITAPIAKGEQCIVI
jgi:C4-dicarboxylate-specific signal transduction histidine kinase